MQMSWNLVRRPSLSSCAPCKCVSGGLNGAYWPLNGKWAGSGERDGEEVSRGQSWRVKRSRQGSVMNGSCCISWWPPGLKRLFCETHWEIIETEFNHFRANIEWRRSWGLLLFAAVWSQFSRPFICQYGGCVSSSRLLIFQLSLFLPLPWATLGGSCDGADDVTAVILDRGELTGGSHRGAAIQVSGNKWLGFLPAWRCRSPFTLHLGKGSGPHCGSSHFFYLFYPPEEI